MIDERAASFLNLIKIMDELREKCPWDKKQTIESIRHLTIEETFELRALKSFLVVQADSGSIYKGTWRYKNAPYFDILFAHKDNTSIADKAVKNFKRRFN